MRSEPSTTDRPSRHSLLDKAADRLSEHVGALEDFIDPVITPTVGRVVWYWPMRGQDQTKDDIKGGQPYPAIITHVWTDDCVNLQVFPDGTAGPPQEGLNPTSVCRSDGDEGASWSWMP